MTKILKETGCKIVVKDGDITNGFDVSNNVVEFKLTDNTTLEVSEACDHYYSASLNKQEVEELIKHLTNLKDQMVNVEPDENKEVIEHPVYTTIVDKFMEVK